MLVLKYLLVIVGIGCSGILGATRLRHLSLLALRRLLGAAATKPLANRYLKTPSSLAAL